MHAARTAGVAPRRPVSRRWMRARPAGGCGPIDLPPGARPPLQLWIAAFAAPLMTLRGIAELFRDQLRGGLTSYFVRPQVVVFGANERAAALITAQGHVSRWRRPRG